jgi:hypothetical protein
MAPPRNLYKITLPPHTNQTMEVTFLPAFNGPVVSLVYLLLHFSTLTRNIPQTLQISVAPRDYRSLLSPDQVDDAVSEPETDDHVGLGHYWPGPGPSRSRLAAPLDDIVVIDTKSESEVDSEETIQVVSLSPLFPGSESIPYTNRNRSWTQGRERGRKQSKLYVYPLCFLALSLILTEKGAGREEGKGLECGKEGCQTHEVGGLEPCMRGSPGPSFSTER